MTSALDMCVRARQAWERSQPQLFLELDDDALEEDGSPTLTPGGFEPSSSSAPPSGEATLTGAGFGALAASGHGTTGTDTSRSTNNCSPGKAQVEPLVGVRRNASGPDLNNNGLGRSPWTGGARPRPLEAHHA